MDAPVKSPEWWRAKLLDKLSAQAHEADFFQDYYDGTFPDYGIVTTKYREEFGTMLRDIQDNWMELIVDAEAERMHVDGFRFGEGADADSEAWEMWQRSHLDSDSGIAHTTALTCKKAFALVTPQGRDYPLITIEHPTQMIVATDPANRRNRLAALKKWTDEWTGKDRCTLYLPDQLYRWGQRDSSNSWEPMDGEPNPLGVVPVVPLINRPDLFGGGKSELQAVTSTQDQINKLVCDMIVASEFQAYQQRWGTGVEPGVDPDTGEPRKFKDGPGAAWFVADPEARFGAFPNADLTSYPKLLENRIQSLASRTRTPPHYLLGGMGDFPSGESLKATETGLIAKARAQMRHFDEGWEEVIRLGFKAMGDDRAKAVTAETIWRDPESRTESEHVDALVKLRALGVPMQQLWEDRGYTPTQIARFRQMALEEALNRAVAGVPPVNVGEVEETAEPIGT